MNRCKLNDKCRYIMYLIIGSIATYGIYTRFSYPSLTETQLFLKMIGL